MALNGTFYGTTANDKIKPKIEWSAVQDVAGNYSDITATLSYSRNNQGYPTSGYWEGSLSIGGNVGALSSVYLTIDYNSNTAAITHTARVYHDSYGNLSVTISAEGRIYNPSSSTLKSTSISAAVTLDTIPRATTIGAGKADIESALIIALNRKNDSFTHSIQYRFGNLSGYIDANGNPTSVETKLTNTNPWFNLPADFYSQIPDSDTGVGTLCCRTYSGDTQIGDTQAATFYAVAARSKCSPSLTWNARDINEATKALTGNEYILVKNHSIVHCELRGEPRNGASIQSAAIDKNAVALDADFYGAFDIKAASGVIAFYVKDSREYDCTAEGEYPLIDYIDLTCNVAAARTDPVSGNAELNIWGQYFNGSFTAVENTLSVRYKVDGGDYVTAKVEPGQTDYSVTVPLEGLDYQESHRIEVVVADQLTELTKTATVGKGIPVFHWGEGDFAFHVPVAAPAYTGVFGGLHIQTVSVSGSNTFGLQTKFAEFTGIGHTRQSFFLFGYDNGILLSGVVGVNDAGSALWSGTEGIAVSAGAGGTLTVTMPYAAYDTFTVLSCDPFAIA